MNVTGRFFGPLHPSHYSLALSLSLSRGIYLAPCGASVYVFCHVPISGLSIRMHGTSWTG